MKFSFLLIFGMLFSTASFSQKLYVHVNNNKDVVYAIDISKDSGLKDRSSMIVMKVGDQQFNVQFYSCDSKGCLISLTIGDDRTAAQSIYRSIDHDDFYLSLTNKGMITLMSEAIYTKYVKAVNRYGTNLSASVAVEKVDPRADCFDSHVPFCFGYFKYQGGPIDIRD